MSEGETPYRSIWTHMLRTSFTQGWVDAGGINTRFVQAGDPKSPALIMLPGTASSWECFAANLESHSKHFNCLAPDFIGCGFTDKPDHDYEIADYVGHLLAFMTAMDVDKASIIGVSLGAWVAARTAVDHPEKVDKLILLAPSGMISHAKTMNRIRGARTKAVDDPSWENVETIFSSLMYSPENRIPDLVAIRQAIYRQPEMKAAMNHILCLQDPDVRARNNIAEDEWKSIQAPTLVYVAPDDSEAFYNTALRAKDMIPNAQSVEMYGVKHWPHFEKPDEFNPVSIEFLLGKGKAS